MKRIVGFLSASGPHGLTIGQEIPEEWARYTVSDYWWVTPSEESNVYGWCVLEDVIEETLAELAILASQLGPRAMTLLVALATRLVKGAKEHGDFAAPKELCREALEEHLDAVVYLALQLQQDSGRIRHE